MADFPENEIEILDDYVSDDFIPKMRQGLFAATISIRGTIDQPNTALVKQILSDRRKVMNLLNHPAFVEGLVALRNVMKPLSLRDFGVILGDAKDAPLVKLKELPRFPSVLDFGNALRSTPVEFEETLHRPNRPDITTPRTLPGYAGPRPTNAPLTRLLAWSRFLSKDTEHGFRVGLLEAEASAGLRKFKEAIDFYDALLTATPSGSPRQKFVAIRSGFAWLALGDVHFRSARNLSHAARTQAESAYESAIKVVQEHGVSPSNPLHAQIVDYARNRLDMSGAGINFLGLRDSFVPVHRHQFLLGLTQDHIAAARHAVQKFEDYQSKADNLEAAEQETKFELDIAQTGVDIALDRQAIAAQQVERTGIQIDEISRQQGPFTFENLATVFEGAGKAAASANNPSVASIGIAGMIAGHEARQNELAFQKRLAELDQEIANLEAKIGASEVDIANKRVQFLQDKLAFGGGRLDKDLYYALAQVYEQLTERQVEAAIRYAYLYERALAFFLGKPGIDHIQLDYRDADGALDFGLDADGKLITAADRLNEDVLRVTGELGNVAAGDVRRPFTEPPFSLAREFPIEFSRFLQSPPGQTARMDFVISFHQLSKRRPDCHQVRIIKVVVRIPSIAAAANFAGTLTHWGRFLVRDKDSTLLDPRTVRLIPTPAQVDDALREQREGGTAQAAIGGVIPYALAHQPIPFGAPSDVTNQFTEFTLGAFEGYGPAGPWQLELRNINVRNISDITLTFDLEAATDATELEGKVDPLIAEYEQELADQFLDGETLDRMKVFSLRRQFRDAFEAISTGTGTFALGPQHFDDEDFDGENARVRTVVAQALDPDRVGVEGVQLEITKAGTSFLVARSTGGDGFSEDFSQGRPPIEPPENRPAGPGTWEVRLPDPTQFDALGDLVLFFVCDFQ